MNDFQNEPIIGNRDNKRGSLGFDRLVMKTKHGQIQKLKAHRYSQILISENQLPDITERKASVIS